MKYMLKTLQNHTNGHDTKYNKAINKIKSHQICLSKASKVDMELCK